LQKLLKILDIPKTTFHGLRDTHATFLYAQDIDLVYVSKRLGHMKDTNDAKLSSQAYV